jgi:type IV pilus assembly protein PilC
MAESPRAFGSHVIELIRVGESSGNLDQSMQRAADHLERTRELRMTVINALAYPVIVTVLAIAVAAFLVIVVIPKLQKYLGDRGRELPQLTTTLLEVSAAVQTALPYLAIGLVAGIITLVFVRRWPPGKLATDRFVLRLPLVGMIFRLAGTAMVARGLGVLIESGVTLLDALAATARLPSNEVVRARLTMARDRVMRGSPLSTQLEDPLAFTPMLPRMVAVGEQAGTLTHVLDEVARFSDRQLLGVIRRMSVLVEPIVIIVVGGIVGFVYIAFFLALFALAGNIR